RHTRFSRDWSSDVCSSDLLRERLSENDARVLHQVVGVDVQVAGAAEAKVEGSVTGRLLEHVIQEGQPRRDLDAAGALQADLADEPRLLAVPLHPAPALSRHPGAPRSPARGR